jgi:hypothetical protein
MLFMQDWALIRLEDKPRSAAIVVEFIKSSFLANSTEPKKIVFNLPSY